MLSLIREGNECQSIINWQLSVGNSLIRHEELHIDDRNYCQPLEPTDDSEATTMSEYRQQIDQEGKDESGKIMFRDLDSGNAVLHPDSGYSTQWSEDHFTDMSGLSDISITTLESGSGSCSNSDERAGSECHLDHSTWIHNSGEAEVYHKSSTAQAANTTHGDIVDSDKPFSEYIIGDIACIFKTYSSEAPDVVSQVATTSARNTSGYTHHVRMAAIKRGDRIEARHLNNLRMAWDTPHYSHTPQQPGYPATPSTRPSPDWDGPTAEKPQFAQRNYKSGLLDSFNEELKASYPEFARHQQYLDAKYPGIKSSCSACLHESTNLT